MIQLKSYASDPAHSRGRLHDEKRDVTRGPRDDFQRDRDRIIHSISFRRLRHKTQVFVAPDGDHYRVRLTHSLEVAQIGRTLARALGLNEDLTEALCLAHDIGHPPFGHAGEDALEEALTDFGGFDHNAQTIRTLTKLETPYPRWNGLNLTWEMLEGLAKHHDIDDGMRAGLLTLDQLLELPFIAERWQVLCDRFSDVPQARLLPELIRDQIGLMVNDVLETTRARIDSLGVQSPQDVRQAGQIIGGFSELMAEKERKLKRFMYENLYHHPKQMAAAEEGKMMVGDLVKAYREQPELMPESWVSDMPSSEPQRTRHIADFLAGMTDRYARNRHAMRADQQTDHGNPDHGR